MNGGNFNLGVASLADTGQWLLVVEISYTSISAVLKNVDYNDTPTVTLFNKEWDSVENELLPNIETAVYDNPRILEDFATHVIINSEKVLWIPAEITEDEEFDPSLFTCVYPSEEEDIFADFGDEEVCLYSMVPGLKSFIGRTLPGSRVSSHISVLKSSFEKKERELGENETERKAIYINIHQHSADILSFSGGKMLSGAIHCWRDLSDLVYKVLLVAHAYGIKPNETEILLKCPDSSISSITDALEEFFPRIGIIESSENGGIPSLSFVSALAASGNFKIIYK